MRFLPAAAVVLALLVPSAAQAAPAVTTKTVRYTASSAELANPGRGFFTFTEAHFEDYEPLDADELTQARLTQHRTLVFRIFYLEKYRDVDTIAPADLALIRADFAAARAAGVKMVVRFAYTADDEADAPLARVLKHLTQLKPILTGEADVLLAVQAGLIGRWGEWYYTQNFPAADVAARKQVIGALLDATAATTPIQVRTPQYKQQTYPASARIGVHNDCFLASDDDFGTYGEGDRAWLAKQSTTVLVGGETCAVSERSGWATASREMAEYHWTYLNPTFNSDVLDSWGSAGRAEAGRKLGYRLRLTTATLPVQAKRGARITARLTLTNDGYAAPVHNRAARLVLAGPSTQSVPIRADLRTWQPGKPVTLSVTFTAPAKAGSYALSLSLPDPSARLAANPAYAIQLADSGVWDAARGRNRLGVTLKVA